MAQRKNTEQNFEGFGTFYDRFVQYAVALTPQQRKVRTVVGLLIVIILATASSIPFINTEWYLWVQAIVGFPGGIILFAILTSLVKTTSLGEQNIFLFKSRRSQAQRIRALAIVVALIIILLFFIGKYLPYGVGGVLIVATALTIYNLLRRTPEELAYAKQGIVDPRDIKREDTE